MGCGRGVGQANPIWCSASVIAAALSKGSIDGARTSPAGWVDVLGNTAKYATLAPGMGLATSAVTVDKQWLDGLPEADRKAIHDVLQEIIARQWRETVAKDRQLIDQMVAKGGHYRVMAPPGVEKLKTRFVAGGAGLPAKHAPGQAQPAQGRKGGKHN